MISQDHEKEDDAAAEEEPRRENLLPLAGSLLWESLGGLFLLNVLSLAIIVPVVGIGLVLGLIPALVLTAIVAYPTFVGMMGGVAARLRYEPGRILGHYWRTMRASGLAAIGFGLIFHVFLFSYLLTTSQLTDGVQRSGVSVLWLVQTFFFVLAVILLIYALPLLALYGMSLRLALRNSLLLAFISPFMAIGMVGFVIVLGATIFLIGAGMWLIVPPLAAVFFVANCHLQVERVEARSGAGKGTASS